MAGMGIWYIENLAALLRGQSSAGRAYGPAYQKALYDLALLLGIEPAAVFGKPAAEYLQKLDPTLMLPESE